jgi:hypothetical protein
VKFGVPIAAAGGGRGGGGGGRGGGAGEPANVLARVAGLKGQVLAFWEMPSDALLRQINEVKPALDSAIREAQALLTRASTVSQALRPYNITLTIPPQVP